MTKLIIADRNIRRCFSNSYENEVIEARAGGSWIYDEKKRNKLNNLLTEYLRNLQITQDESELKSVPEEFSPLLDIIQSVNLRITNDPYKPIQDRIRPADEQGLEAIFQMYSNGIIGISKAEIKETELNFMDASGIFETILEPRLFGKVCSLYSMKQTEEK